MARATEQASRRQDMPATSAPDETPVKGAQYVQPQREDVTLAVRQTVQLITEWRKAAR